MRKSWKKKVPRKKPEEKGIQLLRRQHENSSKLSLGLPSPSLLEVKSFYPSPHTPPI